MKWREKLGDYLIDVSKYFFTGVLVTSLVRDYADMKLALYVTSSILTLTLLSAGVILIK